MMDRRGFIKASSLAAVSLAFPGLADARGTTLCYPPGVFYTRKYPGVWAKKVGSHAPRVKVEGCKVTIITLHPMSRKHYIVRHTLVTEDGEVLGAKTFTPEDKKPVSTYDIPKGKGKRFYATSFCNLHDFWITEFTV